MDRNSIDLDGQCKSHIPLAGRSEADAQPRGEVPGRAEDAQGGGRPAQGAKQVPPDRPQQGRHWSAASGRGRSAPALEISITLERF